MTLTIYSEQSVQTRMLHLEQLEHMKKIFAALRGGKSAAVLRTLIENGEMTVKQLTLTLRIVQSEVSMNLGGLRKLRLVRFRKDGRSRVYSVNTVLLDRVRKLVNLLGRMQGVKHFAAQFIVQLTPSHYETGYQVFRALAHPVRLRLLNELIENRDLTLNVTNLYHRIGTDQPTASHHLALLRESNLVGYEQGNFNKAEYYYYPEIRLLEIIADYVEEMITKPLLSA